MSSVFQGMEEPTNFPRALRHSRSEQANPPLIQGQGLMYQRVLHVSGRSSLSTSGQMALKPLWQQAPSDSSNSREPHNPAPDIHHAHMASSYRCTTPEFPIASVLLVLCQHRHHRGVGLFTPPHPHLPLLCGLSI